MCADAGTYTSSCVQMTLNHLVKMRTRPTQNVIFTPNAPHIAPYLLCSWRDNEGITSSCLANDLAKNKYRPRHRNAKGLDAAGQEQPSSVAAPPKSRQSVGLCQWGSCVLPGKQQKHLAGLRFGASWKAGNLMAALHLKSTVKCAGLPCCQC